MESYYYIFHPTSGIYIYIQTQYHEIIIRKFETKALHIQIRILPSLDYGVLKGTAKRHTYVGFRNWVSGGAMQAISLCYCTAYASSC